MAVFRIFTSENHPLPPSIYKFNTLKVPSIYTESISPAISNPLIPDRLPCSFLCDNLYKAPVIFYLFSFLLLIFFAPFFREHQSLREPLGIQIYLKFMLNLNTLFKHTFVYLITHSFINSNLGQCFSYVYSISTVNF